MSTKATTVHEADAVAATPIRDLVERCPEVMTVLVPLGIDLCCGGGHPLGEALDLHGIDREPVLTEVSAIFAAQG